MVDVIAFAEQLALIVAQTRDSSSRLSAIKLSALSTGLQRVSRTARKRNGLSICAAKVIPCIAWYHFVVVVLQLVFTYQGLDTLPPILIGMGLRGSLENISPPKEYQPTCIL